jgi:hypothetical protein
MSTWEQYYNFKKISPKVFAKKLVFLTQCAILCRKGFSRKTPVFRRTLTKTAENTW